MDFARFDGFNRKVLSFVFRTVTRELLGPSQDGREKGNRKPENLFGVVAAG